MAQPDLTVTLRAVAAWLESHPEADVHRAHFDVLTGSALHCYAVRDGADLAARAEAIGGDWTEQIDEDVHLFRLRQEIVPGVWYELITNREDT